MAICITDRRVSAARRNKADACDDAMVPTQRNLNTSFNRNDERQKPHIFLFFDGSFFVALDGNGLAAGLVVVVRWPGSPSREYRPISRFVAKWLWCGKRNIVSLRLIHSFIS
jgi:hypothetical protein